MLNYLFGGNYPQVKNHLSKVLKQKTKNNVARQPTYNAFYRHLKCHAILFIYLFFWGETFGK